MELRCSAATRAGAKPKNITASLPPKTTYRRSTTTKAPRKRTFIASMTKFNIDRELASGAMDRPTAFACGGTVAMLSCGVSPNADGWEWAEPSFGNGNGGRGSNGGNSGRGGNSDGWGSSESGPFFVPAVLGAALAVALFAFPSESSATMQSTSPASSRVGSPVGAASFLVQHPFARASAPPSYGETVDACKTSPRSESTSRKAVHISCKGGTLVVPLTSNDSQSTFAKHRVVALPLALTEEERRMCMHCDRQFNAREQLRC